MKKRWIFTMAAIFVVVVTGVILFTVNASAATTEYPLWVAGTHVTSDTLSGEGWRYEPDTNTLVLDGFSYGSGNYGYHMGSGNDSKTHNYAFIYVEDRPKLDERVLNIRLEGEASTIGDPYLSGYSAVPVGGGIYHSYWGIYNKNGKVNITGSARLRIYTNQLCIRSDTVNLDGCTGGVYIGSYSSGILTNHISLKNGSKLDVYCGYGGLTSYNAAVVATQSIYVYDGSELSAEIERNVNRPNSSGVCGVFCEGFIDVRGGKLTGSSYAQGNAPSSGSAVCFGIQTKKLNISEGGVVEAFVKQGANQKTYLRSAAFGYYGGEGATLIYMKGVGVLRAGVQKKNPSGTQVLWSESNLTQAEGWYGGVTATSSSNYEAYCEYTSFAYEGAFVKTDSLSYYRDFRKTVSYPEWEKGVIPPSLSGIIKVDSGLGFYVLGGEHTFEPGLKDGTVPAIRVEAGKLTLQMRGGKTYTMTDAITLSAGTELVIDGDGILDGLNVKGSGKVTFAGGTVRGGKVASTVEMIVSGGNIDVSYGGRVKDKSGAVVTKREYTLTDSKTFLRVDLIKLRSRDYGSTGIYPTNGKKLCLWTRSEGEVLYVRTVESGGSTMLTLNSTAGNPTLLDEGSGIKTGEIPVFVINKGETVKINPFSVTPTAEQLQDLELVWSWSNTGDSSWNKIEDAAERSDAQCVLTYSFQPEGIGYDDYNRYMRCEIYKKSTGELAGVYSTVIHVFNLRLTREGTWFAGDTMTLTVGQFMPVPEGLARWSSITWAVDRNDGTGFHFVQEGADKLSYTFTLEDEMEGWTIRFSASIEALCWESFAPEDNGYMGSTQEYLPVIVYGKSVKLDTQPENNLVLDLGDASSSVTLTVGAREATSYQWQVSKRLKADQADDEFEYIPGANEASYTILSTDVDATMKNYVYRCIISNDVSSIISDEVTLDFDFPPALVRAPDITAVRLCEGDRQTFEIIINPGKPTPSGMYVDWQVSADGGATYQLLQDYAAPKGLYTKFTVASSTVTLDDQLVDCKKYQLIIAPADKAMNGLLFRCSYRFGSGQEYRYSDPIAVTVVDRCEDGHTGGTATCYQPAVCEVCGTMYGDVDPDNHTGTAEWDTTYWNIASTHWKEYTCCHTHIEVAVHTFENGVCTVCGCVCSHPLKTRATCMAEGKCSICGIKTADIDPTNHDLSLGTGLRNKEEPTCTEAGKTGDVFCWNCNRDITTGTVIPAKGHDTSHPANCREPAYCIVCKQSYGEIDPDNHYQPWSAYYTNATETTHEKHWECCDKVVTDLPHEPDDVDACTLCHYGCHHTGGVANCVMPAQCEKCGLPYGETDPTNHLYKDLPRFTRTDDETHIRMCACGEALSEPQAHIWGEDSQCTECGAWHENHTESDWSIDIAPVDGATGLRSKECTVCGMLLKTETLEAVTAERFKVGHNCAFGNDLSMLYAIPKSAFDGCTDIRLAVTKENRNAARTLVPDERTINGEIYYCFVYTGVAAKEMGDTLTAKLEFICDGVSYSGTVDTYSLKAYAMERLENSTDSEFKTLLVNLLNYGSAAQTYFGYRTDALVNTDLTEAQKALATQTYEPITATSTGSDGTGYSASITGKNILFGNSITLLVATSFDFGSDLTGVSMQICYTDIGGNPVEKFIDGKDFVYRDDITGYTAYFDGLKASEFRTRLEITLMKDDAPVSETITYSLDAYAQNRLAASTDANFKALLEKTLIYSDSAKAYFSKTN